MNLIKVIDHVFNIYLVCDLLTVLRRGVVWPVRVYKTVINALSFMFVLPDALFK
jgi:hypothetical protein